MVIVRIRGGLGNQLFQYAAGMALAEHHGTALKLDPYFYQTHKNRKFELNNFNIPIEIASRTEVHSFTGTNPVIRYLNKKNNYLHCPEVFAQPHYHYYEDFLQLPANIYLSGYWQSEKFFQTIADKIVDTYRPKHVLDARNEALVQQMRSFTSVSLHIRRGDYQGNGIFASAPMDYYQRAIAHLSQQFQSPNFFVFSDDINWCRANLQTPNITFVDWNTGDNAYKDLWLMANCHHNVIANSTFSWWGAWLNNNKGKIVIAPAKWFNRTYNTSRAPLYPARIYNDKDIIPSSWLRM